VEYESLKVSEKRANEEVLKLQDLVRQNRMEYSLSEVAMRQKYENELDNLR